MKTTLFVLAIIFFSTLALAVSVQTVTQDVTVNILETDVAYIYRIESKIDQNIVDILESRGYNVHLIHEDSLPQTFSDFRFVFIGDERFRNEDDMPANDMPVILTNYIYTQEWGLTDNRGASQLGSTSPLKVRKGEQLIQVYTQAFLKNRIAIPYYFLENKHKAPSLQKIASTQQTSSGVDLGDVISYAPAGSTMANGKTQQGNLCFFGISKSQYWTQQAEQLFQDCVDFVIS